jgi:uncharacterized protein (PEP-CTERM system associated)
MCPGHNYMCWRSWLLIVFGWTLANGASAVDWVGDPGISANLGVTYTDNVCQSSENERGAWLGGVGLSTSPTGSIRGRGSRSSFDLGGSVGVSTLSNGRSQDKECSGEFGDNDQQFTPDLYANGSTTLIDNLLKVDARGRAAQNEVFFYGGPDNPSAGNGATNTYYFYSVSPTLSRRLKNGSPASLRYTFDEVRNSENTTSVAGNGFNSNNGALSNSTSEALVATLSNPRSSQITWRWAGNYRKVQYSDRDFIVIGTGPNRTIVPREDTLLRSASLTSGYRIDRRWQVTGTYGWEWNDFQTSNSANTGGQAWKIGVNWTPSSRTSVGLGMGDRFFGKTPSLNISHRRKRSQFTASYNRGITFARDIRTQDNLFNPGNNFDTSLNTQSPIIEERFTLGYTYSGRRATLSTSGNYSHQEEEDTGETATYRGFNASVSPNFSRIYTVTGTLSWYEDQPQDYFGNPNVIGTTEPAAVWSADVQVSRQLSERLNLSLGYQYTDQQPGDSFDGYQENRVGASVTLSL